MSVGPLPLNPSSLVPGPLPLNPSSLVPTAEEVVDVLERLGISGRGLPGIGSMGVPERLGVDGKGLLGIGGLMSL